MEGHWSRVVAFNRCTLVNGGQAVSLPAELATTFIASLEAPKIELLYKENDATKFRANN